MEAEPRIQVTEDGPYAARGLSVRPGTILKTPQGEPVEWDIGEPYPAGASVRLCRCGRSNTKPFCDDSHLDGFDGEETADGAPTAGRRTPTPGGGWVLTDDISLCSKAGFCNDGTTTAWDRMAIIDAPGQRERIEGIAARCPSGRIVLLQEEGAPFEQEFEQEVVVEKDGPYWVRGGVRIESADGAAWETRNRVTLCRCGRSANKPFCDGSHKDVGFEG
ncbi:MAG: CDGSH iron-sulfur domain-containing protein [Actinomycetota bacterium]